MSRGSMRMLRAPSRSQIVCGVDGGCAAGGGAITCNARCASRRPSISHMPPPIRTQVTMSLRNSYSTVASEKWKS